MEEKGITIAELKDSTPIPEPELDKKTLAPTTGNLQVTVGRPDKEGIDTYNFKDLPRYIRRNMIRKHTKAWMKRHNLSKGQVRKEFEGLYSGRLCLQTLFNLIVEFDREDT